MDIYVDYRASFSFVGSILKYLSVSVLFPIIIAIIYGETIIPFIITIAISLIVGFSLERFRKDPDIGIREGFLVVGLTWIFVAIIGSLPYILSGNGSVANPVNALFESMSGFTTTGATVMENISVEYHSHSLMMWRQITQWIGGMGIIVLMIAILPKLSIGGSQLMDAEAPGISVEKLTPRIAETARILWSIYIFFTIILIVFLYLLHRLGFAPNMTLYNSIAHAFTTLPTGGFSPEARSIEAFSSSVQWLIIVFMIIGGTNFALIWHFINGKPNRLIKNSEFKFYITSIFILSIIASIFLFTGFGLKQVSIQIDPIVGDFFHSIRQSIFQSVSILTTTGYASMDFNTWSDPAKYLLLISMFIGGSAGSAAGSIKAVRWYVILKSIKRELFITIHPDSILPIRFSGNILDEKTIHNIYVFTFIFIIIVFVSTLFFFLDSIQTNTDLTVLESLSVSLAVLGNIGPGFGVIGPMENYISFSIQAKLYMIFLMWIGRVEILSILVLFTPSFWKS